MKKQIYGFPHVSKTGGTTILTILRSTFGTAHCDVESWRGKHGNHLSPEGLRRLLKVYPHLKSVNGHAFRPHENYEEVCPIKYFVMFRDPIARCISEYQHQRETRGRNWSFDHYINHVGFNNQTRFLCGEPNHESAIKIIEEKNMVCGLLEKFDESLMVFNKLVFEGALNCSYSIKKAAKKNNIRKQLLEDSTAMALIEKNNAEDIKLYDYITKIRYPLHQATYGDSLSRDLANFTPSGFNQTNIFLNRGYRNAVYKPSLKLHRLMKKKS